MSESGYLENPFTPTFGEVPLYLAGRSLALNELARAFSGTRRHPSLTTAITGARGSGKTALMAAAADEAEQRGWVAVRTAALPGMLEDILISARRKCSHLLLPERPARISGIELGQLVGIEWENPEQFTNWRHETTLLLDQLEQSDTGLLITVDEVQPTLPEMIHLAAVYQLLVTERRKIALLLAGLPHNILALEKDKRVSFMRRAQKQRLGRISDYEVRQAMIQTIEEGGRTATPEAIDLMVTAADGFPFMMQLVGFRTWDAQRATGTIDLPQAQEGIELARAEFLDSIVKTTYHSLSNGDRAYLAALLETEEPTNSAVAKQLGKTNSYALQYKNRLMSQGVLDEESNGHLRFSLPLMREYAKQQSR